MDAEISAKVDIADQFGTATPMADFKSIGEAREKQLSKKIDEASAGIASSLSGTNSGFVSGVSTSVDPVAYMTGLSSMDIKSTSEISDIKKATLLLQSLVSTNPDNPSGWISLCRVEEGSGHLSQARAHASEACQKCPTSEDVWIEAARLAATPAESKAILEASIEHVGSSSVQVWTKLTALSSNKKSTLRRALEAMPDSITLWKTAIDLEEDQENARILLSHAVECCPGSPELWIALAAIEPSHDAARKIINKARLQCPTSHEIWMAGAKLEESRGNISLIQTLIKRMLSVLAGKGVALSRERWIEEATKAEESGAPQTCALLIKEIIGKDLDPQDLVNIWMDDAQNVGDKGHFVTARAIYEHAISHFPHSEEVWEKGAHFEKTHGTSQALLELVERGVTAVPSDVKLWLMAAREKWRVIGDLSGTREILARAFAANSDSEHIWISAAKLESECGEVARAQALLKRARQQANTARVWMKSAILERLLGNNEDCINLLEEALTVFKKEKNNDKGSHSIPKLWMMLSQMYERVGNVKNAVLVAAEGLKNFPSLHGLWLSAGQIEERHGNIMKARAIYEHGRLAIGAKCPDLWLASVKLEELHGNVAMAKALMAKALQECPTSGLLWSEAIFMESISQQKSRGTDALKKCPNDPLVTLALARLFWQERSLEKARSWFERAIQQDMALGDSFAYALAFEMQQGDPSAQAAIRDRCSKAEPRYGSLWISISKSDDCEKSNSLRPLTTVEILDRVAQRILEK